MSYHVFFMFSSGLREGISVPKGTVARVVAHVAEVEETLGIKRTQFNDNPPHWDWHDPAFRGGFPDVEDKELCETASGHNAFVRRLYEDIAKWSKEPVVDGEVMTPEDAAGFWPGLSMLTVEPRRWTGEYYRGRMEHLFEVMRGRPSEGVTFNGPKLSPKQASSVIELFSFLDPGDMRLEVAKGEDHLSDGDEYDWCTRCAAVPHDYAENCHKRGCPVQADWCDEDRPAWFKPAKGEN